MRPTLIQRDAWCIQGREKGESFYVLQVDGHAHYSIVAHPMKCPQAARHLHDRMVTVGLEVGVDRFIVCWDTHHVVLWVACKAKHDGKQLCPRVHARGEGLCGRNVCRRRLEIVCVADHRVSLGDVGMGERERNTVGIVTAGLGGQQCRQRKRDRDEQLAHGDRLPWRVQQTDSRIVKHALDISGGLFFRHDGVPPGRIRVVMDGFCERRSLGQGERTPRSQGHEVGFFL